MSAEDCIKDLEKIEADNLSVRINSPDGLCLSSCWPESEEAD